MGNSSNSQPLSDFRRRQCVTEAQILRNDATEASFARCMDSVQTPCQRAQAELRRRPFAQYDKLENVRLRAKMFCHKN